MKIIGANGAWLFLISVILVSCGGEDVDRDIFSQLDSAQKKYTERAKLTKLHFMSLETMFPDPQVRVLAEAAGEGDISTIDQLVSQGVDVKARGTQNSTPLFWALRDIEGFTRLLELGADPNVLYGDGETIMHLAAKAEDTGFLEAALRHGGDPDLLNGQLVAPPLHVALGTPSSFKVINILLDAGANIDGRNEFGSTFLIVAAGISKFDVVLFLLNRGADYRLKNNAGVGVLDKIAKKRDMIVSNSKTARQLEKVVEWFTERGIEIPPKKEKKRS